MSKMSSALSAVRRTNPSCFRTLHDSVIDKTYKTKHEHGNRINRHHRQIESRPISERTVDSMGTMEERRVTMKHVLSGEEITNKYAPSCMNGYLLMYIRNVFT